MKLRLGITLWTLSWVPYGLILGPSGAWLTAAWTGSSAWNVWARDRRNEFAQAVKDSGWKGAPAIAWNAILHGKDIGATN